MALSYRSVVCLVRCVTLVYCGQTAGWIKIKLGLQVGLGPGHIVLDGDPPTPHHGITKGHSSSHFRNLRAQAPLTRPYNPRPMSIVTNRLGGSKAINNLWLWVDQDAIWYGGRRRPRPHCVRWPPISPTHKDGIAPPPHFWPMCVVAKRLDGSRCHLVGRQTSAQATLAVVAC